MESERNINFLLDQSKDLIWIVDHHFNLVFANNAYLKVMKEVTGVEKKLNTSIFIEDTNEENIEKWKAYYHKALSGKDFEIEEHFYHQVRKDKQYGHISFTAIRNDEGEILSVACRFADITLSMKKKLRASQLMDSSLDVFCSISEEGNFIYVSAQSESQWGFTPEELIDTPYTNLILEEDVPKTNEIAAKIMSGQTVTTFTNRYKRKDGEIAYNTWSARWDAETKTMHCVARDGKEQIEKEDIISQSEQRFRSLVQEGGDMISIIDLEGNYVFTSPTTTSILGLKPEDFDGKNIADFIHPDDLEKSLSYMKRIGSEKKVLVEPFRLRNGSNNWRWIETVLTNMMEIPAINGIVANSRDITEKVEENHHLKLLQSVITNTKDAVLITEAEPFDEPGPRIIYVNEAFTEMTGYAAEEVIGKTPRILQGPNSNYEELARVGKAMRNWESCETTTINYKKNREEFWINFKLTPVADETGWYTHWISIERDVTEEKNKELEKELLAQISLIFNQQESTTQIGYLLSQTISDFGKFDLVEYWQPNLVGSEIFLSAKYTPNKDDEQFYTHDEHINKFKKSQGLPGKVWDIGKQVLLEDITKSGFLRKDAAKKIGIKSILGIPLLDNNQVVGVLIIGTKKGHNHFDKHLPTIKRLEDFIGAEIKRKGLETDFSRLFNSVPELISTGDFEGRFLQINKAGCEILGYTEDEIIGQSFDKYIHPDDLAICYDELKSLESGNSTFDFEVRFITKQGNIIWLAWFCTPDYTEGLIYSTAKNITKEKELRELNRQAGEMAKIGSWEMDLLNNKVYWSEEVHKIHQTDPITFESTLEAAIKFYRKDFQELIQKSVDKCITKNIDYDIEAVIVTASKKELWVRTQGKAEFVEGNCARVYGSFQDITEKKEAELRLKSLSDNLPGVVFQFVLNTDGTNLFRMVSEGSKLIWGFEPEDVTQNSQLVWKQIEAGGELTKVWNSIETAVKNDTDWTYQWQYVMPTGEKKVHRGHGSHNTLVDGTVICNALILDVTAQAKSEELLDEVSSLAKIGSWEVDLRENTIYWSDQVHQLHGTNPNSFVPDLKTAIDFYRADFKELVKQNIENAINTGESWDFEAVIVDNNKQEKWIRAIGEAEFIDGECMRLFGSFQDIQSLKETETRLVNLSENLPGVIYQYVIHPDGSDTLRHVGGNVEELWGFTAVEVLENVGLVWQQIEAAGDIDIAKGSVVQAIENKSKWNGRFRYMLPTGEIRLHLGNGTPSFLADGTIIFNSIILDITKEVKNEELLNMATEISRIGSWEMDMVNQTDDRMFWSPMIREILEVDENYDANLTGGLEFYTGESNIRINAAMAALIDQGIEFDEELLLETAKGNERWIRAIGKSERVKNKCVKIFGSLQDIHRSKTLDLRLSDILDSISDAFYAVDKNLNFTYFNKEAERLLNRKEREILGKNIWEVFPAAVDSPLFTTYQNVLENKISESFQYLYPGDNCWYEVSAYASLDGLSVYFKNIDERIKAEKNLLRAFDEKQNILESIGDGFFSVKKDWTVTYWNKEAELLTGISKERIVGKDFWKIYADAIDTDFYLNYNRAMETGQKVTFEEYYPTLDKWFEVNAYPSAEGLTAYFKDVTLRKKADIRLEEANDRFQKVTEATNDAIWDWDIVNDRFYRSQNIQNFFGIDTPTDLNSLEFWSDSFYPDDIKHIKQSISNALEDKQRNKWEEEYRILNEAGKIVYVVDRGLILRDDSGKAIRMIGAMTDITERKRSQKQLLQINQKLEKQTKELQRSNEELEQFAFITSHDLQEPLRMISSFMEQLERKYSDQLDDKAIQYIHFATDGAKRMKQIILDLLLYSRVNRPSEEEKNVDLNEIIEEFLQLRRKLITEKKAVISYDKLPVLNTYEAPVAQIFHSLLDNALKYSREEVSPIIKISVKETEMFYEFAITDNGIGIDEQFYDKIFIIFQRLHNRNDYDGTGIGLSITKRAVEFLGGEIWLNSTVEKGSTFYFTVKKK